MEMNYNKSKNTFMAWAIVAIVGLLGLNAYQWFSINQLKTQNTTQQSNMLELEKAQAELDQDYQDALERLEELRGDNKEANDLIDSQKKELEIQKAKIGELIWSKRELSKAKEEIAKLNTQVNDYVTQITALRDENVKLTDANVQLTSANQQLSTNLDLEKKEKEELAQARAILASEKDNLSKTNESLSSKVDLANAVKINHIDVKGFEVKDDGKLKDKSKAKDIEMIRVCFTTETNLVTPSGSKKFYIRMINAQGETVAQEDNGSGVLTNKLDNTQVRYTTSGDINYNNKDTNACVDWTLTQKLTKGNYNVEMYNNGYPVGKGSFTLK
jgi:predicted RNase H-like nuclease (RuvC/YqgF family)